MKKKIAIIGSGISGMTAAYELSKKYEVHIYEKNSYLGGHTHTHEIIENNKKYFIDSGFIVFNNKTYPNFTNLLEQLKPTIINDIIKKSDLNIQNNLGETCFMKIIRMNLISKFKNIQLINEQYTESDVCFVPWLIGEEHKNMRKINARYVMGHFELPKFLMNAMVEMPDHGELSREDFDHVEKVFTGHFHKRQTQNNIYYIGNAFPHNFADAWDNDRGAVILEWGQEPKFYNWTDGPEYRVMNLAQLIDNPEKFLNDRTYARVNLDISISYEEATFIKETMLSQYGARELSLIPHKQELDMLGTAIDTAFESVDQIVINQIDTIDSNNYDKKLLLEIYTGL